MFTQENILSSIEEIRQQPMTPERTAVLANLLYIRRHLEPAGTQSKRGEGESFLEFIAPKWVRSMENADGTTGAHWNMAQTDEVRKQHASDCAPTAFWITMNMMYSDYCKVAEKMGVNKPEFYACMAKAFLDDKDAQPDKLARYYEYIAEH